MSHPLFISLMVANACLVLLVVLYYTIYSRYTFYRFNRWLLFAGLLLSVSIPFFRLSFFDKPPVVLYVKEHLVPHTVQKAAAVANPINWGDGFLMVLSVLLITGIVFNIVRLGVRLYSLYRMHLRSTGTVIEHIRCRIIPLQVMPFAFMGNIYLNPALYTQAQLKSILLHEQIHLKGRHTIDMLFVELVQALFWYNPWLPLLQHAVTQNLEYITDHEMINGVMDRTQYQYSLLHMATNNEYTHLTNAFLFTNLKNRLSMMNKKQTPSGFRFAYFLALPFIGATALISSFALAQQKIIVKQTRQTAATGQQSDNYGKMIKPENTATVKAGEDNKQTPTKRVIIQFRDSDEQLGKINIAIKDTAVEMVRGNSRISAQDITVQSGVSGPELQVNVTNEAQIDVKAMVIIDGVIQDHASLSDIDPKTIVSVQVLKDELSLQEYGEKARNGVINIITKKAE